MNFKLLKKLNAFTLAEIMVVMVIISVLASGTITLTKYKNNYVNKYMYYSAFINLKQGVGALISEGCSDSDLTNSICDAKNKLPRYGYNASYSTRNLCYRLSQVFNTVGTIDCTQTATSGFSTATPNFILTNGIRFFNLGTTAATNSYTIYIDFDGPRRSGTLNTDVMAFIINTDGSVYPEPSSTAANDATYLAASVRYRNTAASPVYIWLYKSISYRAALCYATGSYNGAACTSPTQDAACTTNNCQVVIIKPLSSIH